MPKLTLVLDRKPVQVYDLNQAVIRVGRGQGMDILIDNVSVSRRQAELRQEGSTWTVRDLGSSNGTFVNGERVTAERALQAGDEISFGKFSLFFERILVDRAAPPPAAPRPTPSAQSDGTLHMAADEVQKLQRAAAQKRRAQLVWESGGQQGTHYLESDTAGVLVGRSELCDLRLPSGPKHHVLLLRGAKGYEVRNLSWWHTMTVKGRGTKRAWLHNGDLVEVGGVKLTFMDEVR